MKIIVGLGNPGRKYSGTRHNIGFEVIAELAARFSAPAWRNRFESEATEIIVGGEKVLVLAPQTFMNLSGRSVKAALNFHKLSALDVLIVCDDINLDVGRLRIRASGSAGGQNGLKNIIAQLGTPDFARLRVGVGKPDDGEDLVNFVLQTFTKSERNTMMNVVFRACDAIEMWIKQGVEPAMNQYNRAEIADQ